MVRAKKIKRERELKKDVLRCEKCGKKLGGWDDYKIYQEKYDCECCCLICYNCQYWEKQKIIY